MSTSTSLAAAQSPVGFEIDQFIMRQLCHTLEFLAFLTETDFAHLMEVSRACRLEADSAEEKWFREFHTDLRLFGEKTSRVIQPPEGLTMREVSIISTRLPQAFDVGRAPTNGKVRFSEGGEWGERVA
ncbi:hypothetical protein FOL47_007168 [Perkinsus chesapeaki]|uniref:Uncharacterized protein n=1 Tax=Perkinsus chesapeaki TaxID=330153 RepID=A0A7J6LMC3_PERCH|nr:hypothetical protein FOL47_007168 [Perkinsus chesapeaki]